MQFLFFHNIIYVLCYHSPTNSFITVEFHTELFWILPFLFSKDMAVEDPGDSPVISARYGRHRMSRKNATDFLPFFGTDIGM